MSDINYQLLERFEHYHSVVHVLAQYLRLTVLMRTDVLIQDKGKAADQKRRSSSSSSSSSTAVELSQLAFLQYTSGSTRYTFNCNYLNLNKHRCRLCTCAHRGVLAASCAILTSSTY
jgi:hypothetical protein